MSLYTLIGQLPRHLYVWIDSTHTHREPVGLVPAVWYGLVGHPSRAWGCTVMLENGSVYRDLPPNAIAFRKDPEPNWTIQRAQRWDCYGFEFTTLEYAYLHGLNVKAHVGDKAEYPDQLGRYLFTVAPIGDGFSEAPEQSKEFSFIQLDNGRLTIQPTNHLAFEERSFTTNPEMKFDTRLLKRKFDINRAEIITPPKVDANDEWKLKAAWLDSAGSKEPLIARTDKPAVSGIYKVQLSKTHHMYAFWDSKKWMVNKSRGNVSQDDRNDDLIPSLNQDLTWWGPA